MKEQIWVLSSYLKQNVHYRHILAFRTCELQVNYFQWLYVITNRYFIYIIYHPSSPLGEPHGCTSANCTCCHSLRFLPYVPPHMRDTHYMVKTSTDQNNCYYASVSVALTGKPDHAMRLRLFTILYGAQNMKSLEDEVTSHNSKSFCILNHLWLIVY